MADETTGAARTALASRLRVVAAALLADPPLAADQDPAVDAAAVLDRLVAALAADPAADRIWLVLTAIAAAYPTRGEVDDTRRRLQVEEPVECSLHLLDSCLARAQEFGEPLAELDLIENAVVVDVDHTAKFNLHTGIQRVARNLMPHWSSGHSVVPVAWTPGGGSYRRLSERETERVLDWARRGDAGEGPRGGGQHNPGDGPPRLVVPWRTVVVLAEVPPALVADRIAGLGAHSGNRVVGIGYDAIPVVSADMVPPVESAKYVRYLTAVKFAARVAGISSAATAEVGGFVRMLVTQGLPGPVVLEVSLPAPATPDDVPAPQLDRPLVLVVGSHEPRKNHLAILHAAELLWREGVSFSLRFIGGSGWGEEFPRRAADLISAGRPLEVLKAVDDAILDRSFRDASFTVFPSLHEGYGLPVAESLAHGTPVITSDFGSTAEISADGGALIIDPRSDGALLGAMRTLLTDSVVLAELRRQITRRRHRGWQDYARELWNKLVVPELRVLSDVDRVDDSDGDGDDDVQTPEAAGIGAGTGIGTGTGSGPGTGKVGADGHR